MSLLLWVTTRLCGIGAAASSGCSIRPVEPNPRDTELLAGHRRDVWGAENDNVKLKSRDVWFAANVLPTKSLSLID